MDVKVYLQGDFENNPFDEVNTEEIWIKNTTGFLNPLEQNELNSRNNSGRYRNWRLISERNRIFTYEYEQKIPYEFVEVDHARLMYEIFENRYILTSQNLFNDTRVLVLYDENYHVE